MNPQPINANAQGIRAKLKPSFVAPLVLEATKLELAHLILDGPDEDTLYNQYGPGWRLAIIGTHLNEDEEALPGEI